MWSLQRLLLSGAHQALPGTTFLHLLLWMWLFCRGTNGMASPLVLHIRKLFHVGGPYPSVCLSWWHLLMKCLLVQAASPAWMGHKWKRRLWIISSTLDYHHGICHQAPTSMHASSPECQAVSFSKVSHHLCARDGCQTTV